MNLPESAKFIEGTLSQLIEHFDAVQIMATRMAPEGKETERIFLGAGNWYARTGMAMEFLKSDEAETLSSKISSKLEPPPDDAEQWKSQP